MVHYSCAPMDTKKSCMARGSYISVHFKNAHEVGAAIKNMPLVKAEKYLHGVIAHKQVIAFRRYNGSIGRHGMGHAVHAPGNICRWPEAACKEFLSLLQNLKANGEAKGLDVQDLIITHVQVNKAPVTRRRTYRAHGRIGPYEKHPAHIEIMCTTKDVFIEKCPDAPLVRRMKRKEMKEKRVAEGESA